MTKTQIGVAPPIESLSGEGGTFKMTLTAFMPLGFVAEAKEVVKGDIEVVSNVI
jgi:hypothetical protein